MDIADTFAQIGAQVIAASERAGVKVTQSPDGEIYCTNCGEPLRLLLEIHGPMVEKLGQYRIVPRNCRCMREMFDREDEAERKAKLADEIRKRRMTDLTEKKYREKTFAVDDGRNPQIRRMCEEYVEQYAEVIKSNHGLAFLGENRTGKTFWASCLANALLDAGATVYMTTLKKLIDALNVNYGEDRETLMRKIRTVDFLILDDYGAERGSDFSMEQAFDVIDTRSNAEKPLIITTNLTKDALHNPPTIQHRRAYTRIIEMCPAQIEVKGARYLEIAEEKRKALSKLLRGD